jgi:hypothetical protein
MDLLFDRMHKVEQETSEIIEIYDVFGGAMGLISWSFWRSQNE